MKTLSYFKHSFIVILSIAIVLMGTSCDKEPTDEMPDLPPISSIIMDYSDFDEAPIGTKSTVPSVRNFSHAYSNVVFWHGVTTVTLALPVIAYAHALEQEPEYKGDHTWEWYYEIAIGGVEYKVTLTASRLNNEEFSADLSINYKALPGKGNTWFEGTVRYDHTSADWTLYKYEDGITQVKILNVDWNHDYETETGNMTYEYVELGHDEEGSFIRMDWFTPQPVAFDAAYTIDLYAGTIDVEWNRTTKAGRVADPNFFGDDMWHCWDENLLDVDCSAEE